MMGEFKIHSKFKPTGDQPAAIESLVKGIKEGNEFQTLLGVGHDDLKKILEDLKEKK